MSKTEISNGKRGGLLKGKPHYDKNGNSLGGIKAVVTDAGGKPVELEGGEVIINKEASKKYWKELSKINQSAGNGVPILPPDGAVMDEDPEEFKDGGNIIEFNPNHLPNKWITEYAESIKKNHPEIWKKGGNIFGNEAFNNLLRVRKRGYWLDSEEWMYIKWRSYVARHKKDFRIEGVVAMLKWCDTVDKGWAYMKNLIKTEIAKSEKKTEKMARGGNTKSEPNSCQVLDKNGNPAIDDKSLRKMEKCILKLPQTKDLNLTANGKYKIPRKKLHKKIIDEFKKNAVCITKGQPIAILMGGSPASGKSSFLKKYRPFLLQDEILKVDADEIRAKLPEYKGFNATQTHQETKDIVNTLISDRNIGVPCDFDLIYDGTMNNVRSYKPLIELLRSRNYKIFIVYMDKVPKDVIMQRMKDRYLKTGRFVPAEVVDDFFQKGKSAFEELKPLVDGYMVVDGSNQEYDIIERGGMQLPKDRAYSKLGEKISPKELEKIEYKDGGKIDKKDSVELDIPLMIRIMELAREDIKSDKELHDVAERLIEIRDKGVLTMEDYDFIANLKKKSSYQSLEKKFKDGGAVLLAPNGKPSNLTTEQYKLVRTPEFKAWFGDWENDPKNASKVVDENGEPLVCYHGSNADFNIFDKNKISSNNPTDKAKLGFWFTDDLWEAEGFAYGFDENMRNENGRVITSFLNIREPLNVESNNVQKQLNKKYSKDRDISGMYIEANQIQIKEILNSKNDGIVLKPIFIVFEPNQIKLADGTNTTFDGNNPDIRFKKGGNIPTQLYHYTSEINFDRILDSNILKPSEKYGNRLSFTSDSEYHKNEHGLDSGNTKVRIAFDNEKLLSDGYSFSPFDHSSKQEKLGKEFEYVISRPIKNVKKYIKDITIFKGNAIIGEVDKSATDYANKYYLESDIKYEHGGLLAPNGNPSNLTTEQYKLVRTPEFKAWFGDWENDPKNASKVVDSNGEPRVVYHGTNVAFNSFEKNYKAHYFAVDKKYAEFVIDNYRGRRASSKVIECFLNIRKLQKVKFLIEKNPVSFYLNDHKFLKDIDGGIVGFDDIDVKDVDKLKDIETLVYVALNPNQIKLADGTNTTFDPNSDDIRFETGGTIDLASFNKNSKSELKKWDYKHLKTKDEKRKAITFLYAMEYYAKNNIVPLAEPDNEGSMYLQSVSLNDKEYNISFNLYFHDWDNPLKITEAEVTFYDENYNELDSSDIQYKRGGRTVAQTPAPKQDQVYGSQRNAPKSSKDSVSAEEITFDARTLETIENKVREHNEDNPTVKITVATAKAVVRRGMGAYSKSHRPTISGGQPNSRVAWGLARLNAFLYKAVNGRSKSGKYSQDNDLLEELGIAYEKFENGGNMSSDDKVMKAKELLQNSFDYLEDDLELLGKGANGMAFLTVINNEMWVAKYTRSITEFWLSQMAMVSNPPHVVTIKDVKKLSENFEYGIIHKYTDNDGVPNKAVWNVAIGIKFKEYLEEQKSVPPKEKEYVRNLAIKLTKEVQDYFEGITIDTSNDNWGYEDGKLVLFDIDGNVKKAQYEEWMQKYSSSKLKKGGKIPKKSKGGDCYVVAGRIALNNRLPSEKNREFVGEPYVIHAQVIGQGAIAGLKYGHAWVEDDIYVYDYSNGRELKIPKEVYYKLGQVIEQQPIYFKYTFGEAKRKMAETGHFGSWDLITESGL